MLLYVECHTYPNTLHLTPEDRPLIVDLLPTGYEPCSCCDPLQRAASREVQSIN
jgi:hypothetical protein